jgi:hypothetical protein
MGVAVALVCAAAAYGLLSRFYGGQLEAYRTVVRNAPPGFITGLGVIVPKLGTSLGTALFGLGPGTVNSAPVSELNLVPKIDGLVLGFSDPTVRRPLTYRWMNQSYLVALAETGLIGLTILASFWGLLVIAAVRATRRLVVALPELRVLLLSRLSAVLCLAALGISFVYWNDSPFTYLTMLTLAPMVRLASAGSRGVPANSVSLPRRRTQPAPRRAIQS